MSALQPHGFSYLKALEFSVRRFNRRSIRSSLLRVFHLELLPPFQRTRSETKDENLLGNSKERYLLIQIV